MHPPCNRKGRDGNPSPNGARASAPPDLGVSTRTLERLKQRFVEQGLEAALERKPRERPPRKAVFDAALQARLVVLACSAAPDGRERWTLRLLADKVVELGWAESVLLMTIQRTPRKTNCSLT